MGSVCVSADYSRRAQCPGVGIESAQVVDQKQRAWAKIDQVRDGQLRSPTARVGVAADRAYGCDAAEPFEDIERTHVARVHDEIRPTQSRTSLFPEQSVGVGDDADQHAFGL